MSPRAAARAALILALALGAGACGRKGDPIRPSQAAAPSAIERQRDSVLSDTLAGSGEARPERRPAIPSAGRVAPSDLYPPRRLKPDRSPQGQVAPRRLDDVFSESS